MRWKRQGCRWSRRSGRVYFSASRMSHRRTSSRRCCTKPRMKFRFVRASSSPATQKPALPSCAKRRARFCARISSPPIWASPVRISHRRDRLGADRHQRRQWPPGHHAAARACGAHRHRESGADAGRCDDFDSLLPRSATGQDITNYVSVLTGAKAVDESDGPEHFHIVLLDNGRSKLLGTKLQTMLRCIRCGACMNHCPVYQKCRRACLRLVYPGPMGSVLTPSFAGLAATLPLPNASTLCGACAVVSGEHSPAGSIARGAASAAPSQFAALA